MRIRRSIKVGDLCEYEDCGRFATKVVFSRKQDKILKRCSDHYVCVLDEDHPEYSHKCENCGCWLPIS
jgi:hypothetical protein